jgi:probable rRNA maturation factor
MILIDYSPGATRGECKLSKRFIFEVGAAISKHLKLKENVSVSVSLVDAKTIKKINREYRRIDEITDVLAFLYNGSDVFGEILICPSRARDQASASHRSIKTEMTTLLVHGFLHLFGYDHLKVKDAKTMFNLQERIVKSLLC